MGRVVEGQDALKCLQMLVAEFSTVSGEVVDAVAAVVSWTEEMEILWLLMLDHREMTEMTSLGFKKHDLNLIVVYL